MRPYYLRGRIVWIASTDGFVQGVDNSHHLLATDPNA
jgi:hypothetical protein